jgi:hypothetical protein
LISENSFETETSQTHSLEVVRVRNDRTVILKMPQVVGNEPLEHGAAERIEHENEMVGAWQLEFGGVGIQKINIGGGKLTLVSVGDIHQGCGQLYAQYFLEYARAMRIKASFAFARANIDEVIERMPGLASLRKEHP